MVAVGPTKPPARLLPYIAGGAALGVAVREASALMWPTPTQRSAFVLLLAALAAFPLGWMIVAAARSRLLAVVWGWSGALSSISAISTFALAIPPLWAFAGMVLVPLSAATGVAAGAIVRIRHGQRRPATDETVP